MPERLFRIPSSPTPQAKGERGAASQAKGSQPLLVAGGLLSAALALPIASAPAQAQAQLEEAQVAQTEEVQLEEASFANAKTGWYLELGGLYKWLNGDDDSYVSKVNAMMGDLSVGYDFGSFRIDGSVSYGRLSNYEFAVIDVCAISGVDCTGSIINFLANLHYDIQVSETSRWTPYIGLGVGYGTSKSTLEASGPGGTFSVSTELNGFLLSAGAGLSYAISESWEANVELNYHRLAGSPDNQTFMLNGQEYSWEGLDDAVFNGFGVGLGLRYRF